MQIPADTLKIQQALAEPFPTSELRWRPITVSKDQTQCVAFPYLTARAVMDRLDEVMGCSRWKTEFAQVGPQSYECKLSLLIEGEWVHKCDVGDTSEQPRPGDQVKAAYSDAIKRSAVPWGIGRYLYRLPTMWTAFDAQKKRIVQVPVLPEWARPANESAKQPAQKPAQPAQQPPLAKPQNGVSEVVRKWLDWIERNPDVERVNNELPNLSRLDQGDKQVVWLAVKAHADQHGWEFDAGRKLFLAPVDVA